MILLVLIASVLIAGVTIYQYKEQSDDYHRDRLERKEDQVKVSINYYLERTTWEVKTENLQYIFRDAIYEIADIQNVTFNIYDMNGDLIKSSKPRIENDTVNKALPPSLLRELSLNLNHRVVKRHHVAGDNFQSSYVYILDLKFKPIGILNIPYFEDDSLTNMELKEFLLRLGAVYFLMLLLAILLAYVISTYITRSLKTISLKLEETRLNKRNEKIFLKNPSAEIGNLVDAYNSMVDILEESAVKLARGEREQAWREMAKQVAHEIKNPLTPMRLSVQNFQRKFDPQDPEASNKVDEFSKTLVQQIDTMSNIASAFSSFANMPAQQNETLNVVDVVKLALDIFTEDCIRFIPEKKEIIAYLDRTQLIRIVTNLVKNAIQAVPEDREPKIVVSVFSEDGKVKISVADNGMGITPENRDKIFEPKFTTKSSGMGLGLGMVKNIVETYKGNINFTSETDKGTVFTVTFPKNGK